MFKKIFKFLLIIVVWLLIGIVLIGGAFLLGYPGEYGVYILAGLLVLWYGFKLARLIYRRQQAARRVKSLVKVEADESEQAGQRRWLGLLRQRSALESSFHHLLQTLNMTELSRRGDPLYVLPWVALIGDTAPQTSEFIRGARLAKPTIDLSGLTDTATGIEWHLNNQSLLISTPAEFVYGDPASSDSRWLELLGLLARHRRAEPLNATVITFQTQLLLNANTEQLVDHAHKVRRLIEDSIQITRKKVPVYVMVTGLEELDGVPDWLAGLSDDTLRQAVGLLNEDNELAEDLSQAALEKLADQIRSMNLQTIHHAPLSPDLMRLPSRLKGLSASLVTLVSTLFQDNPYQRTPALRGLYFAATTYRREHAVSAFTRDVFEHIVPMERARIEPVKINRPSQRLREHRRTLIGAGSAGMALFVLTALYVNDRQALNNLRDSHVQMEASAEVNTQSAIEASLTLRRQDLTLIRELEERRWLPWLPFNAEQPIIERMQSSFATKVQQDLILPIDDAFTDTLEADFFSTSFDPGNRAMLDSVGSYTGILVRRINLLNAYLEGAGEAELRAMPMPYDATEVQLISSSLLDSINNLYLQSLLWRDRSEGDDSELGAITTQRDDMVATLERILAHSGGSLTWIINWLNGNSNYPGYDLADQWQAGSRSMQTDIRVEGAYTLDGKEAIESYLVELQQASPDSEAISKMLPRFFREYRIAYLNAWETYALEYQQGLTTLQSSEDYLLYINNLNTGRNQYFNALDLVYTQTAPLVEEFDEDNAQGEELPDWLLMVDYYNDMISLSPDEGTDNAARNKTLTRLALRALGTTGPLGKALSQSGKKGLKTQKKLDKASGGPTPSERLLRLEEAADLLGQYRKALADFVFNAERRSVSYSIVRSQFENANNPGGGSGSLAEAKGILRELQALVGKPNRENQAFWTLFEGPVELIEAYVTQEAACHFNDKYRNEFLAELEIVPAFRRSDYTYGPEGVLWRFMDNEAAPFVERRLGAGYVKVSAGDRQLPLNPEFLRYTSQALEQRNASPDASVLVETRPTETNLDAIYGVSETRLQLQCPAGASVLVNRNFANSETFNWTKECADTRLQLSIGAVELEKIYSGPDGFPRFLDEFRSGSRRFVPEDFPQHEQQLREYGLSSVRVQYNLSGYQELLRRFDVRPSRPPANAAACWNGGS